MNAFHQAPHTIIVKTPLDSNTNRSCLVLNCVIIGEMSLQIYGPGYEPGYNDDDYRSPSEDSGLGMGITDRNSR